MSDDRDQGKFNVRLPPGMRERIAEQAKENKRSMNSEIVARLATTFEAQDAAPISDADEIATGLADKLMQRFAEIGVDLSGMLQRADEAPVRSAPKKPKKGRR